MRTKRKPEFKYKRKSAFHFRSYADGKCAACGGVVEEGEEAVYVPKAKVNERFFHDKCVAAKLVRIVRK